jgi:hypothetical protein
MRSSRTPPGGSSFLNTVRGMPHNPYMDSAASPGKATRPPIKACRSGHSRTINRRLSDPPQPPLRSATTLGPWSTSNHAISIPISAMSTGSRRSIPPTSSRSWRGTSSFYSRRCRKTPLTEGLSSPTSAQARPWSSRKARPSKRPGRRRRARPSPVSTTRSARRSRSFGARSLSRAVPAGPTVIYKQDCTESLLSATVLAAAVRAYLPVLGVMGRSRPTVVGECAPMTPTACTARPRRRLLPRHPRLLR